MENVKMSLTMQFVRWERGYDIDGNDGKVVDLLVAQPSWVP